MPGKTKKKPSAPAPPAEYSEEKSGSKSSKNAFPIVGIGASAGGLSALKALFSKVSESSGLAYIVVVHMASNQPSIMPELLQNVTPLPVLSAEDGQRIEPDHIYVIPPDKEISIFNGVIQLMDLVKKAVPLPIDSFLCSLALDQGRNAAAVILSGTGTDGTLGVKEIKAHDGLIFVQSEKSAEYDGMPRSAIYTGLADMVLPPEEIPKKLVLYFQHPAVVPDRKSVVTSDDQKWLNKIFVILRTQIGHDFSAYKPNTILRRISRRMGLNHIGSHNTYIRFLRENPLEVEALFRELLIGVTRFFRDADSFKVLSERILPELLNNIEEDGVFRAWVPGCSTGEEVYSLVILLCECLKKNPKKIDLQFFATDIDDKAIEKAREGLFPACIAEDVSSERLEKYFSKEGTFFRVKKEIRDLTVFSVQNVIKDPPFSRLNMLCCRNLLIYLEAEAQKKLLPLFHYTLLPGGILMLGSSENTGGLSSLFKTLDKKWKIFRRREVPDALRENIDFPSGFAVIKNVPEMPPYTQSAKRFDIRQMTQKVILDQFAPTALLINAGGEILYVQGRTGKYLETPSGSPTYNILDQAREGLKIELSSALRAARSSDAVVIRKHLSVKTNGDFQLINLHVCPLQTPQELAGRFLIVFEDIDAAPKAASKGVFQAQTSQESSRISELEKELQINRESHQITIEELESSNEELKSSNEELQSSNEELQSTNEELESSKEELQSLNEELQTVNAELQSKLEELSAIHDDMRNLLNSTEIATIFVDGSLNVRRFTTEATKIINLIPTDIGRPIRHVVSNLDYDRMITDLAEVIETLIPCEIEVKTDKEKWYNMRIMPYRTTDNRIDGAVLTFSSIDDQKKNQGVLETAVRESEQARELAAAIFDMNLDPMAVLDRNGKIIMANTGFSNLTGTSRETLYGTDFFNMKTEFFKTKSFISALKTALKEGSDLKTELTGIKTQDGKECFAIQADIIKNNKDVSDRMLLHCVKITERQEKNVRPSDAVKQI